MIELTFKGEPTTFQVNDIIRIDTNLKTATIKLFRNGIYLKCDKHLIERAQNFLKSDNNLPMFIKKARIFKRRVSSLTGTKFGKMGHEKMIRQVNRYTLIVKNVK
jgi:hypothetical protein